jgi:branched-chain amino acid transport system permease protein
LLGLIFDLTILRPVYQRQGEARVLLSLLLTLGLAFVIDGYLSWKYPTKALTLRIGGGPIEIIGVRMVRGAVVASIITVVVLGVLLFFFRKTTLGRAVRSVIEDEEGARLVGVDPRRIMRLILVMTGVLAALVAVTRSLVVPVSTTAGFELTVSAMIVTVVGGLGSVAGAVLAGIVLGIISTVAASTVGTVLSLVILLVAAAVTILIRPSGLLGVRE